MELLGKLCRQAIENGDECLVLANSKIAEYEKGKFFPREAKLISKVDWCAKNYKKDRADFNGLSWRELFPTFDRKTEIGVFRFDYANSVDTILQLAQFFEFIFATEKPDAVVNEPPANVFTEVAYRLCEKKGITYIGMMGSRFSGRLDAHDREHTCSKYKESFDKLSGSAISAEEREFAANFIKNFVSHKQLPSGANEPLVYFEKVNLPKYYLKRFGRIMRPRFDYFLNRKRFKSCDYESEALLNSIFVSPLRAFRRQVRSLSQNGFFKRPAANDKFFFFPLQFQPEATTSVLATYYCDQPNTVKNIAFSLPFPYKLYVKEHPASIGARSADFYEKIGKMPNVVLISPNENTENLIKKSQGTVVLSGTPGLEAAFAGKPVYVLGNVFYSYHPACAKVNGFEELKRKISEDLANPPDRGNQEETNIRFVVSYFRNTIPGDIFSASAANDTNDYRRIYDEVKKIFFRE